MLSTYATDRKKKNGKTLKDNVRFKKNWDKAQ
jgi:hypothetical protein